MSKRVYIHGTSRREQQRLIDQAEQLSALMSANLTLEPGERLLEIGCGVGAVLGQIGSAHPDTQLLGIDISPAQIEAARCHLLGLGLERVELVVGDGAALPWPANQIDRVRLVWVMEHLSDPLAVLGEARRVLRPGGTIHLTETDYASLRVSPPDAAINALLRAFIAHFNRHGDAHVGPRLGPWLEHSGFHEVRIEMVGVHHWCPSQQNSVKGFCSYLLEFIRPELPALMAAASSRSEQEAIAAGVERFARLAEQPDGALSLSVYQARGIKPGQNAPG
jgi:ubiquinone/menaquinone biosynthesis C-methylase UbiE